MIQAALWVLAFIFLAWVAWTVLLYIASGVMLLIGSPKAREIAGNIVVVIIIVIGLLWYATSNHTTSANTYTPTTGEQCRIDAYDSAQEQYPSGQYPDGTERAKLQQHYTQVYIANCH